MKLFVSLLIALLLNSTFLFGQSLVFKNTFGAKGVITTNLGNDARASNYDVVEQPDGKVLLIGSGITRLLANGKPDTSFGGNGVGFTGAGTGTLRTAAVQADGKILIAYNRGGVYPKTFLYCMRLNPDGSPDSLYNGSGVSAISIPTHNLYAQKMIVQPDGKLLIVGYADSGYYDRRMFAARLLANGTADPAFNGTGLILLRASLNTNNANDVAVQSTGKIIITGTSRSVSTNTQSHVTMRLLANGTPDVSFNGTGSFEYSTTNGQASGDAVNILPNDGIVLAGTSNSQFLIVKLLPEGNPDNNFNGNGILLKTVRAVNVAGGIHIRPNLSIVVTGVTAATNSTDFDYCALQVSSTGATDGSFNGIGYAILDNPGGETIGGSVLKSDGSLLISGHGNQVKLISVAQFKQNGARDNAFGTNGFGYVPVIGTDDYMTALMYQSDGRIIAAASKYEGQISDAVTALIRYTANGAIDSSYGYAGVFLYPDPDVFFSTAILQADNKVLVCVKKYVYNSTIGSYTSTAILFRVLENGTIDASFGNNGELTRDDLAGNAPNNMVVTPDGKILFGAVNNTSKIPMIVRFNNDGTADNTFGTNGSVEFPFFEGKLAGNIVVQPDGKIDFSFSFSEGDKGGLTIMRLLPDGNIDEDFGEAGVINDLSEEPGLTGQFRLCLDNRGRLLVGGTIEDVANDENYNLYVGRFLPNGKSDSSFDKIGHTIVYADPMLFTAFSFSGIAVHPDSSIYVTGVAESFGGNTSLVRGTVVRLQSTGIADSKLATNGTAWYLFDKQLINEPGELLVKSDSSILVGGTATSIKSDADLALINMHWIGGKIYTFIGSGNWDDPANWSYGLRPPAVLPAGSIITILPSNNPCILNVVQRISAGASFVVTAGAKLDHNR